jgi:hypothetical protein
MKLEIGDYVATANDDTHKRIVDISNTNIYSLEYYNETGRKLDFVSFIYDKSKSAKEQKIVFVSHRQTLQFTKQKELYKKGAQSFHSEQERRRKQRLNLAKTADHRKSVTRIR